MNLLDILSQKSVIVGLNGDSKEEVIKELVDSLEEGEAITDREKVLSSVLEREKIMSTGIGDGIAIPHGKSEAVKQLSAAPGNAKARHRLRGPRWRTGLCLFSFGLASKHLRASHQGSSPHLPPSQKRRVQEAADRCSLK